MNGLLLVDKPGGITSFDVVRCVRRWCGIRQVGHCGTLDPLATGLLPVAVGSATRLVEYLMAGDKEYVATLRLGTTTDTQDSEGEVLETLPWEGITRQQLASAVTGFIGTICQIPPMHSALKRNGVPLYRLARQGVEVEREPREIRIDTIEILSVDLPDVSLRVTCGKGTYIRTLCHDLGQALGCGAHMTSLRRTRCGALTVADASTPEELQQMADAGSPLPLLTPAEALANWPGLQVEAGAGMRLANGIAPRLAEVTGAEHLAEGTPVRLLSGDSLAAVGCFVSQRPDGRPGDFELWKVFPEAFLHRKSFTPL